MPYMLDPENHKCVHKKNADGMIGEKVKCHPSEEKAKAHLAALNIATMGESMKYAKDFVPGYKAIVDAPDLRGSSQRRCANCNFYKMMPTSSYDMYEEKGICEKHAFLTEGDWVCDDWKEFVYAEAAKVWFRPVAVKVAGDWELLVNGNPFGPDSDNQWFDENSKIVSGSDIPVIYYHSLEDTKKGPAFAKQPIVIGKASDPEKKPDGVWWKVVLDKTVEEAQKVWEAAKKGLAVASSGAIDYLSRLEINGKLEPYDKSKPGRIATWHMGELSLWDYGNGHLPQAHPHAVAIPALKAIYAAARMPLPPSLVSPKNAESLHKERKGELEKLHKFTEEIENFVNLLD